MFLLIYDVTSLKTWLIEINYNPTVVGRKFLKPGIFLEIFCYRGLKKWKTMTDLSLLIATILLLTIFRMSLMSAHILLTPNKEHHKSFGDILPMVGWRKLKWLKDYLLSARIKCELSSDNKSAPSWRPRFLIWWGN